MCDRNCILCIDSDQFQHGILFVPRRNLFTNYFGGIQMSKQQDRTVYRRSDGKWVNKRNDKTRLTSVHDTQKDAIDAARQNLKNQGGGELTTKGRDGKIRSKDTIPPGRDPNPPKDTEH